MFKKYSILYGIIIPILLLVVAALPYLERSQHDKSTIGHDSKNINQNDLLNEKEDNALNNCIPVLGHFQDIVLMRQIRFIPF